jgi:hypothetical protein
MRYLILLFSAAAAYAQSVSIVSGNGQIVPQHSMFEPLEVELRNALGQPVPNATVTWRVVEGNGQATLGNFETTATSVSDANGIASMRFYQNPFPIFGTSFAQSKVSATAGGASVTFTETTIFTDFQSGVPQVNVYLLSEIERLSGAAGTTWPREARIQVAGYLGGPVPGVALTVLSGDPSSGPAISCVTAPGQQPGTVLTDATGTATCALRFDGQPGGSEFQMRIGGNWRLLPAVSIPFTVTRGQMYTLSTVSGSGQSGQVGTRLPGALIAQLRDAAGRAVPNASVTWDVPLGSGALTGTANATDASGRASTSFTPSSVGTSQVRVRLSPDLSVQAVFSVSAAAANPSCSFSLAPATVSAPVSGLSGTATLNASAPGCAWTAATNAPWLSLTSASSGTGSATVAFSVAPNTGVSRSATLTAGGQTLTITQAGIAQTGCSIELLPAEVHPPSIGVSGEIALESSGSCAWSAAHDLPWLRIWPLSGQGPAILRYTIDPNFGTRVRSGHFQIAGETITVAQPGIFGSEFGRFASSIFFNAFGRIPSPVELRSHLDLLYQGVSRAQLMERFVQSEEFQANGRAVAAIYLALLHRDPAYLEWITARNGIAAGAMTPVDLAAAILNSVEFAARYGAQSDAQFVQMLYTQGLLRAPSQEELDLAVRALAGGASRAAMAVSLVNSLEFRAQARVTAFAIYAVALQRAPETAERQAAAGQLQSGSSVRSIAEPVLSGQEFQKLMQ